MSSDSAPVAAYSPSNGVGDAPTTLRDQAYAQILDGIMSLRFTPGTVLSEQTLAREFGMSRTPIRVALEMVSADGLLKFVPQYGFMVEHTTARTVSEVFEIREAIEGYAIRFASFDNSLEKFVQYQTFFEFYAKLERPVEPGERAMLRDADVLFHGDIVGALDNSVATALLERQLALRGAYLRNLTSGKELREQLGAGGHVAILSAILGSDRTRAENLLAEHLHEGRDFFIMRLASARTISSPPRFPHVRQAFLEWMECGNSSVEALMGLVSFARSASPIID